MLRQPSKTTTHFALPGDPKGQKCGTLTIEAFETIPSDADAVPCIYYEVELIANQPPDDGSLRGGWSETFGSLEQVRAFVRGLQAMYGILGNHLTGVDIPRQE